MHVYIHSYMHTYIHTYINNLGNTLEHTGDLPAAARAIVRGLGARQRVE